MQFNREEETTAELNMTECVCCSLRVVSLLTVPLVRRLLNMISYTRTTNVPRMKLCQVSSVHWRKRRSSVLVHSKGNVVFEFREIENSLEGVAAMVIPVSKPISKLYKAIFSCSKNMSFLFQNSQLSSNSPTFTKSFSREWVLVWVQPPPAHLTSKLSRKADQNTHSALSTKKSTNLPNLTSRTRRYVSRTRWCRTRIC